MSKGKLHELLAVEADLEGKAKLIIGETMAVFKGKPNLFLGSVRTYQPFREDGISYPEEHQAITTTVGDKLSYASKSIEPWFDALAQKEATNQMAKSDLVVDGEVLATDVPATMLLSLESRLKMVRGVYENIPTLAMGVEWKEDNTRGKGVFVAVHPEEAFKTSKTTKSKVLYEATKEHPAQIDKWEETENVGKYTKNVWCGMITPTRKAELIERVDNLLRAVKKARQRANSTEVKDIHIGKVLMGYINR